MFHHNQNTIIINCIINSCINSKNLFGITNNISAQSLLLGISADWYNFKTKSYFQKWNTYDQGISHFFIKPISHNLDEKIQFSAIFPDSISIFNKVNSKSLFLQANLMRRYHLLNQKYKFQPYIEARPGLSTTYRLVIYFQSILTAGMQLSWNDFYLS